MNPSLSLVKYTSIISETIGFLMDQFAQLSFQIMGGNGREFDHLPNRQFVKSLLGIRQSRQNPFRQS